MNELKNFFRVQRVLKNKFETPQGQLIGIFSPMLCEFVGRGGIEFFFKKGFQIYFRTAKAYWKILNGKAQSA